MSPREYAPLFAAALAVLALSAGAATFDAVHRLDGASAAADDGGRVDLSGSTGGPSESTPADGPTHDANPDGGGDAGRSEVGPGGSGSAPLAVALVAGGLLAAAGLLRRLAAGDGGDVARARDPEADGDAAAEPETPTPAPADGVAAAWFALARRVAGADWSRRTPGEVAAAARDAGLPADAVADLRGLFERVRYGGAAATPEREARAAAAVERLPDDEEAREARGEPR